MVAESGFGPGSGASLWIWDHFEATETASHWTLCVFQARLRYKMSTMQVHTKAYKKVSTLPAVCFSSRQTKTISREVNITFCFKSTFCRQIFS